VPGGNKKLGKKKPNLNQQGSLTPFKMKQQPSPKVPHFSQPSILARISFRHEPIFKDKHRPGANLKEKEEKRRRRRKKDLIQ